MSGCQHCGYPHTNKRYCRFCRMEEQFGVPEDHIDDDIEEGEE